MTSFYLYLLYTRKHIERAATHHPWPYPCRALAFQRLISHAGPFKARRAAMCGSACSIGRSSFNTHAHTYTHHLPTPILCAYRTSGNSPSLAIPVPCAGLSAAHITCRPFQGKARRNVRQCLFNRPLILHLIFSLPLPQTHMLRVYMYTVYPVADRHFPSSSHVFVSMPGLGPYACACVCGVCLYLCLHLYLARQACPEALFVASSGILVFHGVGGCSPPPCLPSHSVLLPDLLCFMQLGPPPACPQALRPCCCVAAAVAGHNVFLAAGGHGGCSAQTGCSILR